jgi:hypothetical protein
MHKRKRLANFASRFPRTECLPVSAAATTVAATKSAAAAMEAATAYAAAVESTATYATAMESTGCTTGESMSTARISGRPVIKSTAGPRIADTATVSIPTAVPDSAVVAAATVISTASPITAIPGAGTDKDATDEPARSIVAVRGASVRIIGVVAP